MPAFLPAPSTPSTRATTFLPSGRTSSRSTMHSSSTTPTPRAERRKAPSHRARSVAASRHPSPSPPAQGKPDLEQRLGEKLSILFRIEGDQEHPFSEVVGLLQRVAVDEAGARTLAVCRRDGSVVEGAGGGVIRPKFIPIPSGGPVPGPAPWGGDLRTRPPVP